MEQDSEGFASDDGTRTRVQSTCAIRMAWEMSEVLKTRPALFIS